MSIRVSGCLLNPEYVGLFTSQRSATIRNGVPRIEYGQIEILPDAIPIWGICHKKMGRNVILKEISPTSDCYRCFYLRYRSINVIQMFSTALEKCFTEEKFAIASCPTETHLRYKSDNLVEMLLIRNDTNVPVHCPFKSSHYRFTYTKSPDHPNPGDRCQTTSSSLDACPTGYDSSTTSIHFRDCSFTDRSIKLRCLGDWPSQGRDRYVVFEDEDADLFGRPTFRCGLFRESMGKGSLTLSSDSSCSSNLFSAALGFETFELRAMPEEPWPSIVNKGSCSFPSHLQGEWQDLKITDSILEYKDFVSLQSITSHCIEESTVHQNKYLMFSRSKCGHVEYNCVWFQPRGVNVIEFQIGLKPSSIPSLSLCDSANFLQRTWNTRARSSTLSLSSCPIAGDYTGVLPDMPRNMAKMSSDCNNPDIMFYTVSERDNFSNILEDRVYQCIGQWEEDGYLFAYTKRRDIPTYECFVGVADPKAKGNFLLMEGGANCQRGLQVGTFGMRMEKQNNCFGLPESMSSSSGPWFIPKVDLQNQGKKLKNTGVITEMDLQDLSNSPWEPMTDVSSNSSATVKTNQSKSILLLITLVFFQFLLYIFIFLLDSN